MRIHYILPAHNKEIVNTHIQTSIQCFDDERSVLIEDVTEKREVISKKINHGIQFSIQNKYYEPSDIVVIAQEDTIIQDPKYKEKLELIFKNNEVGMVGVEGCFNFDGTIKPFDVGHYVNGSKSNKIGIGEHVINKHGIGYFDNVSMVNDYWFAIRASLIKDSITPVVEGEYITAIDMGIQVLNIGKKLAVADILIYRKYTPTIDVTEYSKVIETYNDINYPIENGTIRNSGTMEIEL